MRLWSQWANWEINLSAAYNSLLCNKLVRKPVYELAWFIACRCLTYTQVMVQTWEASMQMAFPSQVAADKVQTCMNHVFNTYSLAWFWYTSCYMHHSSDATIILTLASANLVWALIVLTLLSSTTSVNHITMPIIWSLCCMVETMCYVVVMFTIMKSSCNYLAGDAWL